MLWTVLARTGTEIKYMEQKKKGEESVIKQEAAPAQPFPFSQPTGKQPVVKLSRGTAGSSHSRRCDTGGKF